MKSKVERWGCARARVRKDVMKSKVEPWGCARARVTIGTRLVRAAGGARRPWAARLGSGLLAAALAAGCGGASEGDVKSEFASVVERSNSCSEAADCVVVDADCPLPCYSAVNRQSEAEVRRRAAELIDEYESGGQRCAYECVEPPAVECVASRCELVFGEPGD